MSGDDSDSEPAVPSTSQRPDQLDLKSVNPLFWDEIPDGAESNTVYQALEALREEASPEERAEQSKLNGNNKLKMGLKSKNKVLLREAIDWYGKGLDEGSKDPKLNAILYSNRAHVHSLLGNWRRSLEDARDAIKLDPSNVKAFFRAARAALKLGEWEGCLALCEAGRKVDPGATEFDEVEKEVGQKSKEAAEAAERERARLEVELGPSRVLADALVARGYRVTVPQIRAEDSLRPHLDPDSQTLTWPLSVMYPEAMKQDSIQAFHEGDTFEEHLDMMFDPEAPPLEWDTKQEYTRDKVELYYLTKAGKPLSRDQLVMVLAKGVWPEGWSDSGPVMYGPNASKWVRIKESWTLHDLLSQPDYVVPGVPLVFAVAKGTDYRKRFLAGER